MRALTFFRGVAAGAALMYLFDPIAGRRRRARTRHKLVHLARRMAHDSRVLARDLTHRAHGIVCGLQNMLGSRPVSEEVLTERVRAKLGRICSHPHAIEVICRPEAVVLRGPVLASEREEVVRGVRRVPGVPSVIDELEPHDEPGHVSALQGGRTRGRAALDSRARAKLGTPTASLVANRGGGVGDFMATATPAARAVVGTAGLALLVRGLRSGGFWGFVEGSAGIVLIARTGSPRGLVRYTTLEDGRPAVIVRKTVHVRAPVEEVFELWQKPEAFPRFMKHVTQVKRMDGNRYSWRVAGPFGVPFEWTAELTAEEPNRLLAWHTVEGSQIECEGQVRFSTLPDGGTQADVQLVYRPPGGVLGHAAASLLGAGPKKDLDDDLLRLKSLLELGKATGRAGTVTRDEIASPAAPAS